MVKTKKVVKKTIAAKKKTMKKIVVKLMATKAQKPIGEVTHFFTEIKVAIVKFKKPVNVGEEINFRGATTDFKMVIKSMQYDHQPIKTAKKGKEVGIKVGKRGREGDEVYSL